MRSAALDTLTIRLGGMSATAGRRQPAGKPDQATTSRGGSRNGSDGLERRVRELEARHLTRQTASNDEDPAPEPRPRFDRKANHRRYMREWRARQAVRALSIHDRCKAVYGQRLP